MGWRTVGAEERYTEKVIGGAGPWREKTVGGVTMIKPHAGYHYRHGVLVPETTEPGPDQDRDKNRRPGVHAIDRGKIHT